MSFFACAFSCSLFESSGLTVRVWLLKKLERRGAACERVESCEHFCGGRRTTAVPSDEIPTNVHRFSGGFDIQHVMLYQALWPYLSSHPLLFECISLFQLACDRSSTLRLPTHEQRQLATFVADTNLACGFGGIDTCLLSYIHLSSPAEGGSGYAYDGNRATPLIFVPCILVECLDSSVFAKNRTGRKHAREEGGKVWCWLGEHVNERR